MLPYFSMTNAMIYVLAVIGLLILLLLIWLIAGYNRLVKLRAAVKEGFATMDVYLKRRYDLVPNLVEVVKHYTEHERDTLEAIVAGRQQAVSARGMEERIQGEQMMTRALRTLFAVAENYPELKASQNYLQLNSELSVLESDIAQARRYYNAVVKDLNMTIEMFPSNILAAIFSFKPYPYFEAEDYERENQRVQF